MFLGERIIVEARLVRWKVKKRVWEIRNGWPIGHLHGDRNLVWKGSWAIFRGALCFRERNPPNAP